MNAQTTDIQARERAFRRDYLRGARLALARAGEHPDKIAHSYARRTGHDLPGAAWQALYEAHNAYRRTSLDRSGMAAGVLHPWSRRVASWARAGGSLAAMPLPGDFGSRLQRARVRRVARLGQMTVYRLTLTAPQPQNDKTAAGKLSLVRADQIDIRPPDWLLRGILERDTLALLFGDPGCGKTFLAADWAARIATGTPYRGQAVQGGPVIYLAGEGRQGLGRRLQAMQAHHGMNLADAPLFIAPAVAITDAGQLAELVKVIDAAAGKPWRPDRPALIVLDTLARCFGGGDENSTQDMTRFVAACDVIRRRYGCAVLVVHHAGHGDKSRARGAIALKAALDAEYRLDKTEGGNLLLTATKMKDAELPDPLAMRLETVELPGVLDEHGNPVTSAAVEVLDADTSALVAKAATAKPGKRGKWQDVGQEIMRRLRLKADDGQVDRAEWFKECQQAGMPQPTRYRVWSALAGLD